MNISEIYFAQCWEDPHDQSIKESQPLFMFREPLVNYNSWKVILKGRPDYNENLDQQLFMNFLVSYQNNFDLFKKASSISDQVSCITLEKLAQNPPKLFESICQKWQIPYTSEMLNWKIPWCENTSFWSENIKLNIMGRKSRFIKMKEGVRSQKTFSYSALKPEDLDITDQEKEIINTKIVPLYQEIVKLTESYYS